MGGAHVASNPDRLTMGIGALLYLPHDGVKDVDAMHDARSDHVLYFREQEPQEPAAPLQTDLRPHLGPRQVTHKTHTLRNTDNHAAQAVGFGWGYAPNDSKRLDKVD